MDLATLKCFLLWSGLLNMGLLLLWFLFIAFARNWVYRLHTKWYDKLTEEHFHALHYGGMILFKMFIFAVFFCPYFALLIMGK